MHTFKHHRVIATINHNRYTLALALVAGLLVPPTAVKADELGALEITIRVIENDDHNPANELSLPVEVLRELESGDRDDESIAEFNEHEELVDDHLEQEDREDEHHKPEDEMEEAKHGEEEEGELQGHEQYAGELGQVDEANDTSGEESAVANENTDITSIPDPAEATPVE